MMLKKTWFTALLAVGTAGLFGPLPAAAQSAPVPVALSGTAAPAGGNYNSFSAPILNGAGLVGFYSTLNNGSSTQGIFVGAPGSLQTVALQGTAAPAGGNFSNFGIPTNLNESGQLAFHSFLTGGSSTQGMFVGAPGAVQTIALQATAAPAGGNFNSFSSNLAMNGSGQMAFLAALTGGSSTNGVFMGASGSVQAVALQGTAAPAGGGNYTLGFGAPSLNGSGQIAFYAPMTGGTSSSGVFVGAPGSLQAAALQGTAAPAGGNYSSFPNSQGLNGSGQVAFSANLTGGSSTQGIFVGAPGSVQAAALRSTPAPAGGNYSLLYTPRLNGSGQVAFVAELTGGTSTAGIFVGAPGSVQAAALLGTAAPAGGTFSFFNEDPTLNGSGQVAFRATLTGAGVTDENNLGLYAGSVGGLVKVVRTGDVIDVGGGVMRTVNDISFAPSMGGQDGRGMSFNDTGLLAYRLSFTDGTSGVFVSFVPVPEPATLGWAAAGLAGVSCLRRRKKSIEPHP